MRDPDSKPCDSLTKADFDRHGVWEFDLSHERNPDTDETYVTPAVFPWLPRNSDVLFVKGSVSLKDGAVVPTALCARFDNSTLRIVGLALLEPIYFGIAFSADGHIRDEDRVRLREELPRIFNGLPLRYTGVLEFRCGFPDFYLRKRKWNITGTAL